MSGLIGEEKRLTKSARREAARRDYDAKVTAPFVIRFLNVVSDDSARYATEADAVAAGKRKGFEFSVHEQCAVRGSRLCGSWTVFGGYRPYPGSFHS